MPLMSRRRFWKIGIVSVVGTLAVGLVGLANTGEVEDTIEIVPITLHLPRLNPAFNGYRIVQVSDIHMGTGISLSSLHRIVELINAQSPDVVALTGDYVTHGNIRPHLPGLVSALQKLKPRDASIAVLGNHDHYTDATAVRSMLRDSGLVELSNAVHTMRRQNAELHLAGVDDYWSRKDRLDTVLNLLPGDACAILLAHEPDYADISGATGRFDLQLSGHTHGGQVRWPIINRPIIVPSYGTHYPVGRYQVGGMVQYTNRGVGTIPPAVRINCRPEITVFSLYAGSPQSIG